MDSLLWFHLGPPYKPLSSEQKEDISYLERKIKDLENLLDKKNEELKEAEWQIEKLKKEKEELKEAEAKMYQQKIDFEDKNLDAAKRSENDAAKIKELEKRLTSKSSQNEEAALEIYNLKLSITSYEDKIKSSKLASAEQLSSFQEEIKGKEELIQELQSIIKAREVELKEIKEEHEGLEAVSSDQVEVAEKFQKMALNMEEDIEAQKDEIQMLHAAIEDHKEELTRQVSENDVLKEKEINLQSQILKQAEHFKTQQTEIEKLKLKGEKNNEDLVMKLEAKTAEIEDMRMRHEEEILKIKAEQKEIASEADRMIKIEIEKLEERQSAAEKEVGKLQDSLQISNAELDKARSLMNSAISEKEATLNQITSMKDDFETKMNEVQPLLKKTEDQKKEISELKKAGAYFKDNYYKIKDERESLQKQLQKSKTKCEEMSKIAQASQTTVQDSQKKAESANQKVQQLLGELSEYRKEASQEKVNKNTLQTLRDENDELEAKLASTLNSLDHWKSQFEELERFVTPFRQDLAKYAAQSEHLDGENSKKARELQELHQQLAGTMGHQNQKQKIKYVAKIKAELQETKEKLSAKDCELKKARRQIESLADDVNALKGIRRFDPKKAFQTRSEN